MRAAERFTRDEHVSAPSHHLVASATALGRSKTRGPARWLQSVSAGRCASGIARRVLVLLARL